MDLKCLISPPNQSHTFFVPSYRNFNLSYMMINIPTPNLSNDLSRATLKMSLLDNPISLCEYNQVTTHCTL